MQRSLTGLDRRLRSLLALATTPMVVVDDDRRVIDANRHAHEALLAPPDALIGRRMDEFTAPVEGFDVERLWAQFMREGRLTGVYPVRRMDGKSCSILYAATANVAPGAHMSVFVKGAVAGRDGNAVTPPRSRLSPREREILQLIADGLTDREIADRLRVAPATSRTHARNLIAKLGAHTRAQAVAIGIRSGEIAL